MKKMAVILFALLIFVNGLMLTFQYHVFSDKVDQEQQTYSYNQVIDIIYRGQKLIVTQTFNNLPKSEVVLSWPENSRAKKCVKNSSGEDTNCERLDSTMTQFKAGDHTTQQIRYVIPLSKKGIQSGTLIKNNFVALKSGIVSNSEVHITDEKRIGGEWFTGLPRVASKTMALINYSYFKGEGGVYDLYWQKQPLKTAFTSKDLTVYGRGIVTEKMQQSLATAMTSSTNHVDIIQGNRKTNGERIVFVKSLKDQKLPEKLAVSQVKQNYAFTKTSWLPSVMASFLLNQSYGTAKSKHIVKTINDNMTDTQKAVWKDGLENLKGKKVSAATLDQLLSRTLDSSTSYFTMNAKTKKIAPLLFEDSRRLYVNNVELHDLKVILKDGRVLYAAAPLFDTLGYTMKTGKNGYYVKNTSQSYRFPLTADFYVYNNKRYDVASQPIEVLAGNYYIEETWLIRLFEANIEKQDQRIDIKVSEDALK